MNWLEKTIPNHPDFDKSIIFDLAREIKSEMDIYILEGFKIYLSDIYYGDNFLLEYEDIYLLNAIKLCKYGAIYFINREEVQELSNSNINYNILNDITAFVEKNHIQNNVINYAVYKFITNKEKRKIQVFREFIPTNAISAIDAKNVAIKEGDFKESNLDCNKSLYDLHDLCHYLGASLNSNLYGNKYFSSLSKLSKTYKDLIKSPKLYDRNYLPLCDGTVFSLISKECFNSLDVENMSDIDIINKISDFLKNYLLDNGIEIQHLATLCQNKNYELIGSELERLLFVRGSNQLESTKDILCELNAKERVTEILKNNWMLHERRNTLRHRAHKEAYKKVANHFKKQDRIERSDLLDKTILHIDYEDYRNGQVYNLWEELSLMGY